MTTELKPYIYFYGRCEEALGFYASVFRGTSEIMHVKDAPPDVRERMGLQNGDDVMHALFTSEKIGFFASDGMQRKSVDADEGNISLALSFHDGAQGERVFSALADGGKVQMPVAPAFWGGRFASVVDKFGIEWMMTLP